MIITLILFLALAYGIYRLIRHIMKVRYFNSDEFKAQKAKVEKTVADYNEIAEYVKEIPNNNQFVPKENKLEHSDLATFENTSKYNYVRDRNKRTALTKPNVHACSLQIVRRASEEPLKYLCKYFNIKPNKANLQQVQEIGDNISRMENTISNLQARQDELTRDFNPPKFILKHYYKELMSQIGVNLPEINVEYAQYVFEYVSAGGNSAQRSTIELDGQTAEALAQYLDAKIKYGKSAKRQRSLMTNALRTAIKKRDYYTCQMCEASTAQQSLLLLEVDHIIPISKGGLSDPDNLQTLCWKCNRSKGDKIITQ